MSKQYKVFIDIEVHEDDEWTNDYDININSIGTFDTEEAMLDFVANIEEYAQTINK